MGRDANVTPICDEKNCETPVTLQHPDIIPPAISGKVGKVMEKIGCTVDAGQEVKVSGFHTVGYKCKNGINVKLNYYMESNNPKVGLWFFVNDKAFFPEYKLPTRVTGIFDKNVKFIADSGGIKGSIVLRERELSDPAKIEGSLGKMEAFLKHIPRINTADFQKDYNHLQQLVNGAKDARPKDVADLFSIDGLRSDVKNIEDTILGFSDKYGVSVTKVYQYNPPPKTKENLLVEIGRHLQILR